MDQLAEATRPVVRLRDQWMLIDPDLARKARERILKPVTAIDALGAALTGSTEVDGRQVTGHPDPLAGRAARPDRRSGPRRRADRRTRRACRRPCATTSCAACAGWPG